MTDLVLSGYGWTVQYPHALQVLSPEAILIAGPQFQNLPALHVIFRDYPNDEAALTAGVVAGGVFTEEEIVHPPPSASDLAIPSAPLSAPRRAAKLKREEQVEPVRHSPRIRSSARTDDSASGAPQSGSKEKRRLAEEGGDGASGGLPAPRAPQMRRLAGPPVGAVVHSIVTRLNQHLSGEDRIVEPYPISGTNISLVVSSAPGHKAGTDLDGFLDAEFISASLRAAQGGDSFELNTLFESRFEGLVRRNDARSVRTLLAWAQVMLDQCNDALQCVADSDDEGPVGEGGAGAVGRHWTGGRGRRGVARRALEPRGQVI